jgi:septal ring factor EnvC (AmiA/AmiB activator)
MDKFCEEVFEHQMELMKLLKEKKITHEEGMKMLKEKFPTVVSDSEDEEDQEAIIKELEAEIDVLEGDVSSLTKIIADLEEENEAHRAQLHRVLTENEELKKNVEELKASLANE